jgi:hypothetical protein
MKRTGFKRKPISEQKPMKRGKLKKVSKQKISVIQRKIWELCKQIIRKEYSNVCYTCGRTGLIGSDWQTGHMWAKASVGAFLKYDLRILRPQCFSCNIHKGGMGADFYSKMLKEIGPVEMEKLQNERQISVKAYDHYIKLLEDYQLKAEKYTKLNETQN